MKNVRTFIYKLLALSCWLMAMGMLPATAQQKQDALYIFRNDGQFNAFFWGDIDRFEYSKIDTLGIEHHDYVVQEIYALDTVFRIPVSAIDSIAFVTPENKVKDDVFQPGGEIGDYIIASDSLYWIRLSAATPQALIPKKGDKLLIEQKSKYIPNGFGGLVTSVTTGADGITVMTGPLRLFDVYDRLVAKGAAATPRDGGNSGTRQRHDGRRYGILDGYSGELAPEDTLTLPTVSTTLSLNHSHGFLPDESPLQISGDITGSLAVSITPKLALRAFLYLDVLSASFRYTQDTYWMLDTETKTSLSGALNARLECPVGPSFKKTIGENLKLEAGMGLFIEGSIAGFELASTNKKSTWTWNRMIVELDDLVKMAEYGPYGYIPPYRYTSKLLSDTTEYSVTGPGQMSVGFGAFAKAEVTFAIPLEKTPKFLQKTVKTFTENLDTLGFGAEMSVEAGVRIDAKAPFWSVLTDYKLIDSKPIYEKLDNESEITLAGYLKLVAQAKVGNWSAGFTPDATLKSTPLGLVPRITGISLKQDPTPPLRPWRWLAKAPVSRDMFLGTEVGFAVFDQQNNLVADTLKYHYWFREKGKDPTYNYIMTNIDPVPNRQVTYTAYPMVEIFSDFKTPKRLLVNRSCTVTLDPAHIDVDKRLIVLSDKLDMSGSEDVTVTPNMSIVKDSAEAKWLTSYWFPDRNELSVHWEALPKNMTERRGVIRLTGLSHKGDTLAVDSVVVLQQTAYIAVHPDKLTFGKQGGTQVVTIDSTNVEKITIRDTPSGITAVLKDNKLTITVAKNDGYLYTSYVILEGKTQAGLTGSAMIEIKQDGKSPDGPQPGETIAVKEVWFRPLVDAKATITTNDSWGVLTDINGRDLFYGVNVVEEDIASGAFTVTATIVDDQTLHVECQGKKRGTDYVSSPIYDEEPVPGMMCTQRLTFTLEKDSVYYSHPFNPCYLKFYRLTDVYLSEDDEYPDNTEEEGSKKRGEIAFSGSEKLTIDPGHTENGYSGSYNGKYNQVAMFNWYSGKLNVTNYRFEYDSWTYDNWYQEIHNLHADYTYQPSDYNEDLIFGIVFADDEKFTEWNNK